MLENLVQRTATIRRPPIRAALRGCFARMNTMMSRPPGSASPHSDSPSGNGESRPPAQRRVRLFVFSPWAEKLEDGSAYVAGLPEFDVKRRVTNADDPALVQMARLDCDWHGENVRALGAAAHPDINFLPVQALGKSGLADLMGAAKPADEEWWLVFTGQHPQMMAGMIGKVLNHLVARGVQVLYYAFDDASRSMPAFSEIARNLAVLIHDELPLAPPIQALLNRKCRQIHRSWVANLVPFASPFVEEPEKKIVFLGSKLGLTLHRQKQIDFLTQKFKDRFTAICDHSLSVAERTRLSRFKVGFCPEGRKFTTPSMQRTHTDRPFWAGTLGLVPVSENSRAGGRLEELYESGLILRYTHGDLKALGERCEQALECSADFRRGIYAHFNQHETIGAVVAAALA
jgi:hypothetical protein